MTQRKESNMVQKNWRRWKRGKEWVFGCSLFLVLGTAGLLVSPTEASAEQATNSIVEQPESTEKNEVFSQESDAPEQSEESVLEENDTLQEKAPEGSSSPEETSVLDETNHTETISTKVEQPSSPFRNGTEGAPTSTHSGGLRITRGLYDIEFTDAGELASRAGKGDIGFVKINDNAAGYLYNVSAKESFKLEELRDRIILRPKDGGEPVYGRDTANYNLVDESGTKYFKNAQNEKVEALYLVTAKGRPNVTGSINALGMSSNGDGGEGKYTSLVPLDFTVGINTVVLPEYKMVTVDGYYSTSIYLSDVVKQGGSSNQTSMNFFLIAVDTKRPVVNEAVTKANLERALGDSQLNKDNIDSVLTLNNVEVTDNVLRKTTLQTPDYTSMLLRDESGVEHTVADLKALLNGPDAANYANKNYTVVVNSTDVPNEEKYGNTPVEIMVMGIVDKAPLQKAKDLANNVDTMADTQNKTPDSVNAYNTAVAEFEAAKQQAQTILDKPNATVEEILNAIKTLEDKEKQVAEKAAQLTPTVASITTPTNGALTRTVKQAVTAEELVQTVGGVPTTAKIELVPGTVIPTDAVGTHILNATVTYQDGSEDQVEIHLTLTTDLEALNRERDALETELATDTTTEGKRPATVDAYEAAREAAQAKVAEAQKLAQDPTATQAAIDQATQDVIQALEQLRTAKANLVDSDATTYEPAAQPLTRTVKQLATAQELAQQVTGHPQNATVTVVDSNVPQQIGTHRVIATVNYNDQTSETVEILYTITTDTSGLEQAKQTLANELTQPVDTTGKRQSTIDALETAKQAAETELAKAQEILNVAGPTQDDIEAAIQTVNQKLAEYRQAVANLVDSYATTQTPTDGTIERTVKNLATLEEVLATVTVPEGLQSIALAPNVTLPNAVGNHELTVIVTYTDQSSEEAKVFYTITTYKTDLIAANDALQNSIDQAVETEGKRASTVEEYEAVRDRVNTLLAEAKAVVERPDATQAEIDEKLAAVNQAQKDLQKAKDAIVDSDATTYEPAVTPLVRQTNQLATAQDIENSVRVDGATNVTIRLKDGQTVPQTEGDYVLRVVVTYADNSSEEVDVPYTIQTYKGELEQANTQLAEQLQTKAELGHRSPSTAAEYNKVWDEVVATLQETQAVFAKADASQADIDAATERAKAAIAKLDAATKQLQDSMAHTYEPTIAPVEKTTRETITPEDLRQAISDIPADAELVLQGEMTHNEGDNQVTGIIRYSDGSSEPVTLTYTYRRVKDELAQAVTALTERIDTPADTTDMRPATIELYEQASNVARMILEEAKTVLDSDTATQAQIDEATELVTQAKQILDAAISNLTLKDAVVYPVSDAQLETTTKQLATNSQLIAALGTLPTQVQSAEVTGTYPAEPGTHAVPITLTYQDGSTLVVTVHYTIKLHTQTLVEESAKLQELLNQPIVREDMSPKALNAYDKTLAEAQAEWTAAQDALANATQQDELDAMVTRVQEAAKKLQAAIDAIVPSIASQTTPADGNLTRTVKQLATTDDIVQLITMQDLPADTNVVLEDELPTTLGEHLLTLTLTYADDSKEQVVVRYTITTDTTELEKIKTQLATELAKDVSVEGKRQSTVEIFENAKQSTSEWLTKAQQVLDQAGPTQEAIEAAIVSLRGQLEALQQAIAGLEDSYATQYTPTNGIFERTTKQAADLAAILATVTAPGGNPTIQLPEGATLPTEEGTHTLTVLVVYEDQSVDTATIQYTITKAPEEPQTPSPIEEAKPETPATVQPETTDKPSHKETAVQNVPAPSRHGQLPATGEEATPFLIYATATMMSFVGLLLGRKKREEEEVEESVN